MVFLLPGYEAKKGMVIPSYLKVSNKLNHAYWSANIYADFARLRRPEAWLPQEQLGKEKIANMVNPHFFLLYSFWRSLSLRVKTGCELLLQINAASPSTNNPIFLLPASRWSPLACRSHSCVKCRFLFIYFFLFLQPSPEEEGTHYILWKIYELLRNNPNCSFA